MPDPYDQQYEPRILEGSEGAHRVLAVGYFAEDISAALCVHGVTDRAGAELCLAAELEEWRLQQHG